MRPKRICLRIVSLLSACFLIAVLLSTASIADANNPTSTGATSSVRFYRTSGSKIIAPDGSEVLLKSIAVDNSVSQDPYVWYSSLGKGYNQDQVRSRFMTEANYKEIADLGFNSVRFNLRESTYRRYTDEYVKWLDQNLAWAKKYGIGVILNLHWTDNARTAGSTDHIGNYNKNIWVGDATAKRRQWIVKFWREIAGRYKDDPTVIGYGLLNEPFIFAYDTGDVKADRAAAMKTWQNFAQRLADTIRETDQNHIIFVENVSRLNLLTSKNKTSYVEYALSSDTYNFCKINDTCNNVVYETHVYQPAKFTLADKKVLETINPAYTYPNNNISFQWQSGTFTELGVSEVGKPKLSSFALFRDGYTSKKLNDWTYIESDPYDPPVGTNVMGVGVAACDLGEGGGAYYDDLRVYLYNPKTKERQLILEYNLNQPESWWCAKAKLSFESTGLGTEKNPEMCIVMAKETGTNPYGSPNSGVYINPREGYKYIVSARVRLKGVSNQNARAYPVLQYIRDPNSAAFNKEGLRKYVRTMREYSATQLKAPIYIGEFGAHRDSFGKRLNVEGWIGDFIDVCFEEKVHFDYFGYYFGTHGMYSSDDLGVTPPSPNNRNENLYNVLVEKVKRRK